MNFTTLELRNGCMNSVDHGWQYLHGKQVDPGGVAAGYVMLSGLFPTLHNGSHIKTLIT